MSYQSKDSNDSSPYSHPTMSIGQEIDHFHMTNTLAHEMTCGKLFLAVNLKGIAGVILDGANGFLFSSTEPTQFTEKIIQLANNAQLRSEFGQRALELNQRKYSFIRCAEMTLFPIKKTIGIS